MAEMKRLPEILKTSADALEGVNAVANAGAFRSYAMG
jgi:hypothetical protein